MLGWGDRVARHTRDKEISSPEELTLKMRRK
jgi:hypothetical protein